MNLSISVNCQFVIRFIKFILLFCVWPSLLISEVSVCAAKLDLLQLLFVLPNLCMDLLFITMFVFFFMFYICHLGVSYDQTFVYLNFIIFWAITPSVLQTSKLNPSPILKLMEAFPISILQISVRPSGRFQSAARTGTVVNSWKTFQTISLVDTKFIPLISCTLFVLNLGCPMFIVHPIQ